MNAFLAIIRFLLANREKAVLGIMLLLCVSMGGLSVLQARQKPTDGARPALTREEVLETWDTPRTEHPYPSAALDNTTPFEETARVLERRRSIFRPGEAGSVGGRIDPGDDTAWPDVVVRQVSQPTPGGAWIAQLEIAGKVHIGREGRTILKGRYEIQRIDRTRLCVELLRRMDDEVHEFCKE